MAILFCITQTNTGFLYDFSLFISFRYIFSKCNDVPVICTNKVLQNFPSIKNVFYSVYVSVFYKVSVSVFYIVYVSVFYAVFSTAYVDVFYCVLFSIYPCHLCSILHSVCQCIIYSVFQLKTLARLCPASST